MIDTVGKEVNVGDYIAVYGEHGMIIGRVNYIWENDKKIDYTRFNFYYDPKRIVKKRTTTSIGKFIVVEPDNRIIEWFDECTQEELMKCFDQIANWIHRGIFLK